MGTHQPFPVRNAQTKQRPFPRRGFCCPVGTSGTTAASDAHPAPAHFRADAPVIGRACSDGTAPQPPGRGGPPQFPPPPSRAFRAPYAGKSLGAAIQGSPPLPWPSPRQPGLGSSSSPPKAGWVTARQASLHATDRSLAPPKGAFDAGLRRRAFPPDAASLLPGLLAATRTGLPPAGNDELMLDQVTSINHPQLWAHAATP
jgi:hypothetical protein